MVSIILHEPSLEIAFTGESFVDRLNLSRQAETVQNFSWRVQVGQSQSRQRYSEMQLDSNGFSWVSHLEAENQLRQKPIKFAAQVVMDEKHREMTGAEKAQPSTPVTKSVFGKNPHGKHTKQVKEKEAKSTFSWSILH